MTYLITLTTVEWIDLFSREYYREIIINRLQLLFEENGISLYAYVILTNQMHLIISASPGHGISCIIREFKRQSATMIYDDLQRNKREYRRHWLKCIMEANGRRSGSKIKLWQQVDQMKLPNSISQECAMDFIHQSPVKAGICFRPEYYKYSSASAYTDGSGPFQIQEIVFPNYEHHPIKL